MKTIKIIITVLFGLTLMGLVSCSSTSSLPNDDVYYTPGNQPITTYAKPANTGTDQGNTHQNYSQGQVTTNAQVSDTNAEYQKNDDYYDMDYATRIKRFHQSDNSGFGYYDDYYTNGSNDNYACNGYGNPNVNILFGYGMGYNSWSLGYGYGWGSPFYSWGSPYFGWGYPSYGWGGGYWNGYNNGYWNGYLDGYYGGGYYGGGYYPGYYGYSDYGYGRGYSGINRPRRNRTGGTNLPRYGATRRGRTVPSNGGGQKTVVAGSGIYQGSNTSGSGISLRAGSKEFVNTSVGYRQKPIANKTAPASNRQQLKKPERSKTSVRQVPIKGKKSRVQPRYSKPSSFVRYSKERTMVKPRYSKPKQYQRLDAQQPRGSKEYYRPKANTQNRRQNINRSTPRSRPAQRQNKIRQPISRRQNINRSTPRSRPTQRQNKLRQPISRRQNIFRPSSESNHVRTTRPSLGRSSERVRSYSTPIRRSVSSPRSYSVPTRSRSTGGGGYSRSYSAPSRSSSGSSSHSSGSSSSNGRGRRR